VIHVSIWEGLELFWGDKPTKTPMTATLGPEELNYKGALEIAREIYD